MPSFYDRHVVPWLVNQACSSRPVMKQRAKVVPQAAGRVLELGVGSGLNLAFYDPAKVESLAGVDPSPAMRARAMAAARPDGLPVSILDGNAEALPFDSGTFDCVVSTFTLCTVESPAEALREACRVLKPGGRLLFCEHGLAPDANVARWQRRIEPLWKRAAGGCHLTRSMVAAMAAAGFRIERRESMYLPHTPRIAGWTEWGSAVIRTR